ncbi:MAG: serine/threonine-protein phosphatase [Chlamydiae bacterium CG10_big_fil_rev_8_21_14_0_10_42_34]|nr:MAG: serine/threonine-protein phosphatase [Chlamydiae bacterium CG10_big_fil_rev_8_21_14_0_10_42_34]
MNLNSFGLSDIGLSRANNEDVWVALPEIGFFALADGMGGHQGGEIAAREAVEHLVKTIKKVKCDDCLELIIELRHAIEKANQWVYKLGKKTENLNGMGTTLCCLIWAKDVIVYAHVGDSRIYRYRNKKLELLTQDHSLLAKWLKTGKESSTPFPYKNVITRSIGTTQKANPEIAICPHEPNDLFFLCSDGLSDVLSVEEIEKIIHASPDLQTTSERLIEKAKIKGSSDNITILMVHAPSLS